MNWRLELSPEDKDAYTFASAYARVRKTYQAGYRLFRGDTPEILKDKRFKTSRTLAKWFKESWNVSRKQPNLDGYIEYCFKRLAPTIPQIGQLKNRKLLGEFISAAPELEVKELTDQELTNLYRKCLSPELTHTQTLAMLGLI